MSIRHNLNSILDVMVGRVVRFNKGVNFTESEFDEGQKARIESYRIENEDAKQDRDVVVIITMDFKEFAEENKKFSKPTWVGSWASDEVEASGRLIDPGAYCLHWHETSEYPADFKCDFYTDAIFSEFDPVEEMKEICKIEKVGTTIEVKKDDEDMYHLIINGKSIHSLVAEDMIIALANTIGVNKP